MKSTRSDETEPDYEDIDSVKRDAMALAQLLLDIYMKQKHEAQHTNEEYAPDHQ